MNVIHIREPFSVEVARHQAAIGTRLGETMPQGLGNMIVRLNGGPDYISRKDWDYRITSNDTVEWVEFPQDDEGGLSTVLQFVVAVVVSYVTQNPAAFLAFFASLYATVNAPTPIDQNQQQQSPTYASGLGGNRARLYSPIPKICGRHQTFPPYACQPYQEFDANNEQYLYVLLCLGIGNHQVERVMIDDTDITHFSDVIAVTYLPPGTLPTRVLANVINSPEVANQELLTAYYVGGFAACGPRDLTTAIGIDLVMPYGIGSGDSAGNLAALGVSWRVEIRSLNQFGTAITPWQVLATESRSGASRDAQRWSYKYELTTPIRPEVRLVRTDLKSENIRDLNDMAWAGMRAYLAGTPTLNENAAHFEVVMRSSKQLTGVSQNRISVIAQAMVRDINPDGTFGAEIASRNPAHWLADLWTSSSWGEGLPIEQVDMATLYTLSQVWAERQDRFDFVFDQQISVEAASQIIAGAGRARAFRRGGVRTLVRDQYVALPRTAFTTRNTTPGSMSMSEELPQEDLPDGVIVEFFDNRSWRFETIECPCPGITTMDKPVRARLSGITGRIHATREGLFEAAKISYRRRTVGCTTEMQGALPAFGCQVRWQPEFSRWQSGDVVEWDPETLTMTLTEPPAFEVNPLVIVLIRDDGQPSEAIAITPGATSTQVILASDPGFLPSTDNGLRERTTYLLGSQVVDEMMVKLSAISDGGETDDGAKLHDLSGFVDDDRVHAVDNALLPGTGEIQDPIEPGQDTGGGGTLVLVNLTGEGAFARSIGGDLINTWAYIRLRNDGRQINMNRLGPGEFDTASANSWLYLNPVDVSVTALYEARATITWFDSFSGTMNNLSGTYGVWQPLSTTREWRVDATVVDPYIEVQFTLEVREISSGIVQDFKAMVLRADGRAPMGHG